MSIDSNTHISEFGAFGASAGLRENVTAQQRALDRALEAPCDPDSTPSATKKTQWALCGSDEYTGIQSTNATLPLGVYRAKEVRGEVIVYKTAINIDSLMEFPNWIGNDILAEIEEFWLRKAAFAKYGYLHRRGYLLYGPAGGGKTSLVQQIIKRISDRGGLVFLCDNPVVLGLALHTVREIEPTRNIVTIFEDIDATIESYGEDALLSLLDGETQIDRVLNVATSNYPEKLDKRLVGRPRRFDRVIKIDMPNADIRRIYFKDKLKIDEEDLADWVDSTEEFSFAAMAELVISVKCLGNDFEKSVETLRKMMDTKPTDFENDGRGVGFGS